MLITPVVDTRSRSPGLTTAAFGVPGIERVEIHHDKANVRSRAVPRSLGFASGQELPDGIDSPGEVGVDCSWSISRTDWSLRESATPVTRD
jgi:RimJ/RimL family protein N-acetyltransferase